MTEKHGLAKRVSLSNAKHASLWRTLVLEFGHMPLEELLAGTAMDVLSALSCLKLTSRREIAHFIIASEASVAKVLERLKEVGIIQKTASGYIVSPRFQTLQNFVREYRHSLNEKLAMQFAPDARILWECNTEFLIETKSPRIASGFRLTGVSVFGKFGVPFFLQTSYVFYSPLPLTTRELEEAILHSLLVPDGSVLPTLLVWKKWEKTIDRSYVEHESALYGIEDRVKKIIAYFAHEGKERPQGFPPWHEFAQRAHEYGIL